MLYNQIVLPFHVFHNAAQSHTLTEFVISIHLVSVTLVKATKFFIVSPFKLQDVAIPIAPFVPHDTKEIIERIKALE